MKVEDKLKKYFSMTEMALKKVKISKKLNVKDKKILIQAIKPTKREKTYAGTFRAHIKNMILGVSKDFEYKLKICSGHFPMSVTVDHEKVIIKNFLGEKIPRIAKILPGVKCSVMGDEIIIRGTNKENAGQSAANIEMATRIVNRDRRVFQDGIFIISKGGEKWPNYLKLEKSWNHLNPNF